MGSCHHRNWHSSRNRSPYMASHRNLCQVPSHPYRLRLGRLFRRFRRPAATGLSPLGRWGKGGTAKARYMRTYRHWCTSRRRWCSSKTMMSTSSNNKKRRNRRFEHSPRSFYPRRLLLERCGCKDCWFVLLQPVTPKRRRAKNHHHSLRQGRLGSSVR